MKNILYIFLLASFVGYAQTNPTQNENYLLQTSYQVPLDQDAVENLDNSNTDNNNKKIETISMSMGLEGLSRMLEYVQEATVKMSLLLLFMMVWVETLKIFYPTLSFQIMAV